MGIEDRDWYREAVREREGLSKPKQSPHGMSQRNFDAIWKARQQPSGWGLFAFRTLVYCLAVYVALVLVKNLLT